MVSLYFSVSGLVARVHRKFFSSYKFVFITPPLVGQNLMHKTNTVVPQWKTVQNITDFMPRLSNKHSVYINRTDMWCHNKHLNLHYTFGRILGNLYIFMYIILFIRKNTVRRYNKLIFGQTTLIFLCNKNKLIDQSKCMTVYAKTEQHRTKIKKLTPSSNSCKCKNTVQTELTNPRVYWFSSTFSPVATSAKALVT